MTAAMFGNGPAFATLDEIQRWALKSALELGGISSPRGMPTIELLAQSFTLEHPRSRCIVAPKRRWSLPLAIGEFCWHASGSDDLRWIEYYAPRWREFSDDQQRIYGSCYGARIFGAEPGCVSQWNRLIDLLSSDPDSRRAVLNLQTFSPALTNAAKDVSCTTSIQFLVRQRRLHAIVTMRSNDMIWGLPYDIFLFTMLHELLACTLKVDMGSYHHSVGSLHLYKRHIALAERILAAPAPSAHEMPPMEHPEELPAFLRCETAIRAGGAVDLSELKPYWRMLGEALAAYAGRTHPLVVSL